MSQKMSGLKDIFEVVLKRDLTELKKMLRKNVNINLSDKNGRSVLFYANVEQCRLLLSAGANINHIDFKGKNALFYPEFLEKEERQEKTKLLIESGINANIKDMNGNNLYEYCENTEMAQYFIEKGIDYHNINNQGENILWYFAKKMSHNYKSVDLLKFFLEKELNPQILNKWGENILFKVTDVDKFLLLKEYQIDINLISHKNESILTQNPRVIDEEYALYLIESGIKTDHVNSEGFGVIEFFCNDPYVLSALLKSGYTPVQFPSEYYEDTSFPGFIEDLRMKMIREDRERLKEIIGQVDNKNILRI